MWSISGKCCVQQSSNGQKHSISMVTDKNFSRISLPGLANFFSYRVNFATHPFPSKITWNQWGKVSQYFIIHACRLCGMTMFIIHTCWKLLILLWERNVVDMYWIVLWFYISGFFRIHLQQETTINVSRSFVCLLFVLCCWVPACSQWISWL